ncbi:MAG: hypothetical protein FI734_02810 [SAR202 cluster bacterium]|nr:hypothetical protein [SAR202 cluster bacterium]|tara:strand:- start:3291 stop:3983 length:693 start_codon:yes stop_codon:yes gene_type:complete
MTSGNKQQTFNTELDDYTRDILQEMKDSIASGVPWALAVLIAMGKWSTPSETIDNTELQYFIAGEAFDWLLLAERLLREIPEENVVESEKEKLLFEGILPDYITNTEFKSALGTEKYRAYLNYFYGVVVEEMLWSVAHDEAEKARMVNGIQHSIGIEDEVAHRLYHANLKKLASQFQREKGHGRSMKFTLSQYQEFVYWLFKKRLLISDEARTASDTKKALFALEKLRFN